MKNNIQPETRKREHRFQSRELRVKRNAAGAPVIEGYAAVFNSLSEDLGGFREQILPGAFSTSLANKPDVRALFNHDENLVLGRTKAGTLDLSEDTTGLAWSCTLPDTAAARDLAVSIERGDIDQCSFGFYCMDDDWAMLDGTPVRSVKTAEVFDVSAVTYPAYTATSVSMRSLWRDGQPDSIEAGIRSAKSVVAHGTCTCEACTGNNCAGCSIPNGETSGCGCSELRIAKARLRLIESSL